MARKRAQTAEAHSPDTAPAGDVFDEAIAAQAAPPTTQAQEIVQQVADSTRMPGDEPVTGHAQAEGGPRKKWTPPPDPRGFENIKGEGNRAHLLKDEANGAWVIRFDKAANEMTDPEGKGFRTARSVHTWSSKC
jgi:hypothetical protein